MITPTQDDLDARERAAAAGRRIEAARDAGGDAAADAERDAIRAEMGLTSMLRTVTTTESAVVPAADLDEGVEVVGLTMGGEPLPTEGVTQPEAVAADGRQPYEAPVLTPLGAAAPEGATFHQPTKVTGEDQGYVTREKDGPLVLIRRDDGKDTDRILDLAKHLGAFAAGPRAGEDPLRPGQVRALWFNGAFRPFSADWSGSNAFTRASQFADALRSAGLNDVAVTSQTEQKAENIGSEGVQAAEEAPAGMQTPQALAGACGAISVGDRFKMEAADPDSSIYVDWRGSEPGAVHMRAFFDEAPHALGFCRALMKRGDVKEAVACIPASTTEERREAAQAFAADPALGQAAVTQLRAAIRVMEDARKARERRRAIARWFAQACRTFLNGLLLGLGFLAGWAIVGVILGLLR